MSRWRPQNGPESSSGRPGQDTAVPSWVVVELAGNRLAVPVERVRGIFDGAGLETVEDSPELACGILTMPTGKAPVVDLGRHLELSGFEEAGSRRQRIVVIESHGRLIGLLVDGVRGLVEVAPTAVQRLPPVVWTARSQRLAGVALVDESWLILLDTDRLLAVSGTPAD